MDKQHCKDMFIRLGLDTTGLDRYDDDAEILQNDLDELTGWHRNCKEIRSMHNVMKWLGVIAGITATIAAVSMIIRKRALA